MKEIKVEANTIPDAVEKGLTELGLRRDQVEVVVVTEGSKGFLGFGAKKACVCLREKKWTGGAQEEKRSPERQGRPGGRSDGRRGGRPGGRDGGPGRDSGPRREQSRHGRGRPGYQRVDREPAGSAAPGAPQIQDTPSASPSPRPERPYQPERSYQQRRPDAVYTEIPVTADPATAKGHEDPLEHARTALARILELMGLKATITDAAHDAAAGVITVKFDSPESAAFTDDNARGLQSLQFLVNSIVNKSRHGRIAVRIDTCDYWKQKEAELAKQVEAAVKTVQETSQPYRMDPMPAPLRKFVHSLVKASFPGMETCSEGEGKWRKVVIRQPVKKEEAAKP